MKLAVFRYDAGIGTPLSFWYDEYRRPKTGRPRGGTATIKKILPDANATERP
jgi:hypothetical protein